MCPVVLLMHGEEVEELFYPLVFSFGQAISLRMECSQNVLFDSQLIAEGFGEMRHELWVSIQNHLFR